MIFKKPLFYFIFIVASLVSILTLDSCKKDTSFAEGNVSLTFSTDTILFDTLFTTIGSSTYTLLVSNTLDKPVNISQLYLGNGQNSKFRMNVDGVSGFHLSDVEIPAHDSIYIFVEVTIDPNSGTGPMLVTDSILFEVNGNLQDVNLIAYGIDAYFILPNRNIAGLPPFHIVSREFTDTTWTNDKPIVIYGYAVVDSNAILRIEEGTKIFFHSNSGLWIYKGGSLKVMGTKDKPVTFEGDRPEAYYENIPGQWDRIWINESSVDNEINYAQIRNGFIGIQAEYLQEDMGNQLSIKNTIIENMSGVGILSRSYKIDAENLLITNCKQYNLALTMGGNYEFRHCTFANYWNYDVRKTPAVYINNYYVGANNVVFPFDLVKANFYNSIIYGNNTEELLVDNNSQGGSFNYLFDHNLIKTENSTNNSSFWVSILKNQDPKFVSTSNADYHLQDISPAIGQGKSSVIPSFDIEGNQRDATSPDLGVYEYQ